MAETAERQIEQAIDQLAAFEFFKQAGSDDPPRLPDDLSDAALNDHVIDGLEALELLRHAEAANARVSYQNRALRDLRAAIAVHQEWVVAG
jgi:hypothetical protein